MSVIRSPSGLESGSRLALTVVAHVRRCGKEKVLDQLTFGTSCGMTEPTEPSLHKQCRYTCEAETARQFHVVNSIGDVGSTR